MGVELEPENPPEAKRWTPEQARQFIEATADDPLGLAYRVMILSGSRRAELVGFRWAHAYLEVPYSDPDTGTHDRRIMSPARSALDVGASAVARRTGAA